MSDFLRRLGLNKYESDAYMTLLKLGSESAFKLSSKSSVPFGRIYDSLKNLENKGLVEIVPTKPKKYKAVKPDLALNSFLDEKNNEIEKLRTELGEFVKTVSKENETESNITVTKGKHNFAKLVSDHFNYKDEFWATSEGFKLEKWFPSIQRYAKRPPSSRYIFVDKTKADVGRLKELIHFGMNIKHFPLENVRILISDEELVTISIQEPNSEFVNINLRNKYLGKAFIKMFRIIWKEAEKI
ncbi:HTH-type sugar sensing transcriptional regulator TrmBL1 [Candidatus Tiddalikarchaeum anstoanum]|nr:HTH-type sugar sensing transcriptional regulator TrmBL1 [Candidatus Tiddalikarchaeum anstoanum]